MLLIAGFYFDSPKLLTSFYRLGQGQLQELSLARAEIKKYFRSFFGANENFNTSF